METETVLAEVVDERPRAWGFWATAAFSLLVIVVSFVIQIAVSVVVLVLADPKETFGLLVSVGSWAAFPFSLGLIALFVRLRNSWSLKEYLALHRVPAQSIIAWCCITVLYGIAYDVATSITGRTVVQDMMLDLYRTCGSPLLFGLTLVIEAPVFEEVFFRGFMFRGLQSSRVGAVGAIVLTSLTWTVIHIQYEAPELLFVFGLGIILGIARWRSGSVYLTMAMHALWNFVSLVQVHFLAAK